MTFSGSQLLKMMSVICLLIYLEIHNNYVSLKCNFRAPKRNKIEAIICYFKIYLQV